MEEFDDHIRFYSMYAQMHFSKFVSEKEWGNRVLAESFLRNYWLSEQEYLTNWKLIQDKIFQNNRLPDLVFQPGFQLVALRGGNLFLEEDFIQLQKAMIQMEETFFVVIQHHQDFTEGEPKFRIKFPVSITRKELLSGNYISSVLFEMTRNDYYVFGSSGNWGKYTDNDYDYPMDLIGYKSELASIFRPLYQMIKEENGAVTRHLSKKYIDLLT